MGAATAVTDLADLRRDLLERLREATGVTATNTIADRFLNQALHDMHISPQAKAPWAERRAFLLTHATYSTGTVTISASTRTTVTGTTTLWNTAVTGMGFNNARAGGKMTFAGDTDVYEVASVESDTSLTLTSRYIATPATLGGPALAAGSTYTYFEDEYALASDFFRPVDLRSFDLDATIPLVGGMEFRRKAPRNSVTGKPRVATLIQLAFSGSTTPRPRVVFYPPPDVVYSIPYTYITSNLAVSSGGVEQVQLTATTDEPIVPLRYRHLIVLHALKTWYRDRKDDPRSKEAKAEYDELMVRITGDTTIGQDRPRLVPRTGQYYHRRQTRRGIRYQTGTEFDDLRV